MLPRLRVRAMTVQRCSRLVTMSFCVDWTVFASVSTLHTAKLVAARTRSAHTVSTIVIFVSVVIPCGNYSSAVTVLRGTYEIAVTGPVH